MATAKTLSITAVRAPELQAKMVVSSDRFPPESSTIRLARTSVTPVNFRVPTEAKSIIKKSSVHQSTRVSTRFRALS